MPLCVCKYMYLTALWCFNLFPAVEAILIISLSQVSTTQKGSPVLNIDNAWLVLHSTWLIQYYKHMASIWQCIAFTMFNRCFYVIGSKDKVKVIGRTA